MIEKSCETCHHKYDRDLCKNIGCGLTSVCTRDPYHNVPEDQKDYTYTEWRNQRGKKKYEFYDCWQEGLHKRNLLYRIQKLEEELKK